MRFDDVTFKRVHGYDLDFALSVVKKGYNNYVCFNIDIVHYSKGNVSKEWLKEMMIFNQKWDNKTPCIQPYTDEELEYYNFRSEYVFFRDLMRGMYDDACSLQNIFDLINRYPKYKKGWTLIWKYFIYRIRKLF